MTTDSPTTGRDVPLETARELLVDLVATPSPSGEETAAADRLAAFFETYDREVWIDDVGNVRAPADDSVLLTSHVDTVPGEIPVRVEAAETGDSADVLWGRGSVDATGSLAAMAVAAVRTGVSFAGVVGEETDSRGARHLVTDRAEPAAVINGEPSGTDGITLGYRGLLAGTYTASTASRHSSRPEPNAIQRAMTWWAAVETALDREAGVACAGSDDSDEPSVFEQVTAKPVSVDGATSDDGLTVEATIAFQLRIPPAASAASVRERVRASTEIHGGDVAWTDAIPPVMASPRTPVARAFRAAIRAEGGEPRLLRKTGTSDMNVFADRWSCPMATYGPGDASLDHTPDEHLSLAAFDRSIAVLERVATTLAPDDAGRTRSAAVDPASGDDGATTDGDAAVATESTAGHAEPPHGGDTQ